MGLFEVAAPRAERYRDPHLEMDIEHKTAFVDSKPVVLTRKEFDLLALLLQNAGELVTRQTLLLRVWGYNDQIRTRTLDVHVRRLRKKLGGAGGVHIETIFSVGYRLQPYRAPGSALRLLM
jgi:DNA-binding response OmpR family regulator